MKILTKIFIALLLFFPHDAVAFGKNKVQHEHMTWEFLDAPHWRLYFHQDQAELPEIAYRWLDEIYTDLSRRFMFAHEQPIPTMIYGAPALFEQTNIITEILPDGVGGFTELFKNRIAVPYNGSYTDLRHVLHHEMVHAFVFGAVYGGSVFRASAMQVPLWFNEGLAEILSSGWNRDADMYMIDRVLNSQVPLPGPMLSSGYIAYKGGQSFLYYLHATGGDTLFNRMIREFVRTGSAERAIETVYKNSLDELGREWQNELRRLYWPEIGRRALPTEQGVALTESARDHSRFNRRPRISPNGELVAFFSDRQDYTRIIIADTSGKTIRRIRQHSISGSFESVQPSSGALAWSPSGDELAFIAKKNGRDEVRIVTARNGRLRRRIQLPMAAVTGLDWSKDGGKLAMTAVWLGRSGLYTYDLTANELAILDENTPTTKESPRFSPCGTKIIFAQTDTVGIAAGPFSNLPSPKSNIAIFDIETEETKLLTNNRWNDRQPAFSPCGEKIVFTSDRNGIDNLYIADLNTPASAHPLTDYTGASAHPDWSADGSSIVFDLFMSQAWNIWRIKEPLEKLQSEKTLAKTQWAQHEESGGQTPFFIKRSRAAQTNFTPAPAPSNPPRDQRPRSRHEQRERDSLHAVLDSVYIEISAPRAPDTIPNPQPYRLRFSPDMVMAALGVEAQGNGGIGTAGMMLVTVSDLLGDHRITMAGDLQIDFSEYARVFGTYEYLKLRTNFILGAFYNKYYSHQYNGQNNREQFFHDLETGGFIGASYPFSMFSRVSAQVFARHMQREPLTGENRDIIENNAALTQFGYAFDNILWGITGPVNGTRMRANVQLAPVLDFTDEAYVSFDIDIRRYTHVSRRFVWANRVTAGATFGLDDNRAARRFYLGGDNFWLNFRVHADNYSDNLDYNFYSDIVTPLRGWNYFDITGDKMLLLNSEWRFPFIREISTVWPLPLRIRYVNGALFMDTGYAWDGDDIVPPKMVAGYGFGMRANLGIFVLRYDRGWPTDFRGGDVGSPVNYFSLGAEF